MGTQEAELPMLGQAGGGAGVPGQGTVSQSSVSNRRNKTSGVRTGREGRGPDKRRG